MKNEKRRMKRSLTQLSLPKKGDEVPYALFTEHPVILFLLLAICFPDQYFSISFLQNYMHPAWSSGENRRRMGWIWRSPPRSNQRRTKL
jgi:hypothetical protein